MKMLSTNWNILTGGPSAGKSSTLNSIASLGYKTIPEIARVFIDKEISKGKNIKEIRGSELKFQEIVLEMKNEIEDILNPNELIFFDRGIWDSVPFMELAGATSEQIKSVIGKRVYKNIFLLEQVPFKQDYARIESAEQADLISNLLFSTYSNQGYNVIRVPVMHISSRVDFILNRI